MFCLLQLQSKIQKIQQSVVLIEFASQVNVLFGKSGLFQIVCIYYKLTQ